MPEREHENKLICKWLLPNINRFHYTHILRRMIAFNQIHFSLTIAFSSYFSPYFHVFLHLPLSLPLSLPPSFSIPHHLETALFYFSGGRVGGEEEKEEGHSRSILCV